MHARGESPSTLGFTLLEMLVVLTLMGLAVGMVLPRLSVWIDGVNDRGWRADLRAYVESIPVRVFLSGEVMAVDAEALVGAVPGVPVGMQVVVPETLSYGSNGAASGGVIELRRNGVHEIWKVEPISGLVGNVP